MRPRPAATIHRGCRMSPRPITYADSATLRAVRAVGGILAASRVCGVSRRAVQNWCEAGAVPGLADALALADAAGIDVRTLECPRGGAGDATQDR